MPRPFDAVISPCRRRHVGPEPTDTSLARPGSGNGHAVPSIQGDRGPATIILAGLVGDNLALDADHPREQAVLTQLTEIWQIAFDEGRQGDAG
jgi:hypothetical protein